MDIHTHSPQPARARAVFSTEDTTLLKTAVLHYLETIKEVRSLSSTLIFITASAD